MNNKKKIILGVLIFVIGLILLSGLSYAFFSANVSGGETDTTITVTGGVMNIHYDGGANINVSSIVPSDKPFATKTFTVTGNNTTDIEMYYDLNLVVEENTFSQGALKYKLASTNNDNNGETLTPINDLTSLNTGSIYLGSGSFDSPTVGAKVHTYKLELYFPETNDNQNIDQGKTFKAYILINGSKGIPRNLYDTIIAQGGGVDAIKAKGKPDFSKITPEIITYKEVITESLPVFVIDEFTIGSGYIFDKNTGEFTLTDYMTNQKINSSHIGQYFCSTLTLCKTGIFRILEVTDGVLTKAQWYRGLADTVDNSIDGIYLENDEYGESYYYRGGKTLNNNLIFAGFQWKIIRINGDNSIRLIYNGTEEDFNTKRLVNDNGSDTQLVGLPWNETHHNDAKYLGYMYGGKNGEASTKRNGNDSLSATFNETSNSVKVFLDNWYKTNIVDSGYSDNIIDNLFCNDRGLFDNNQPGFGSSSSYFSPNFRAAKSLPPTIMCEQQNDRYTVSDELIGNGALSYPVGLLTYDEGLLAGLKGSAINNNNYLSTDAGGFWTMSPYAITSNAYASVYRIAGAGNLNSQLLSTESGVRPVLSISSSALVTGTGSSTDPFIVKK